MPRKVGWLKPSMKSSISASLIALAAWAYHHGSLEVGYGAGQWRKLSPSAELMVDPGRGARCAIRDTGAPGEVRYHWTVTVFGGTDPVAAGRTGELGEARSLGILAYVEVASRPVVGGTLLANGSLAALFWRVLDALDFWLTQGEVVGGGCGVRPRSGYAGRSGTASVQGVLLWNRREHQMVEPGTNVMSRC